MKRYSLFAIVILGVFLLFLGIKLSQPLAKEPGKKPPPTPSPVYNPYPARFLPADLQKEINRVNAETDSIFAATLAAWKKLPINSGTH